ncbi:hypothetical protein [Bradyrhizobium cenepequi]
MALDIIGPANAPNSTTIRPADTRVFGADDTWTKDCTSATANDGTKIQAGFLNGIIAQVRNLIRGNGQTGAAADVVTLDNLDDSMLLKSTQHLIQRGQPRYGEDTGAASAIVVALSPAPAEYKTGMELLVKIAVANTGATTINVNGLGTKNVLRPDLTALLLGDLIAGSMVTLAYNGTAFVATGLYPPRPRLSAPQTYYVNASTGSDSNNGLTAGTPFLTLQKAENSIALYDLNGFSVTVNVAAGTYAPVTLIADPGSGTVTYVGDPSNPSTRVISAGSGVAAAVYATRRGHVLNGFKLSAATGVGANADADGTLTLQNMRYGTCAGAHIAADVGSILLWGTQTIDGNATSHFQSIQGADIRSAPVGSAQQCTLTIAASVSITSFAYAHLGGRAAVTYALITGAASVTGKKYDATTNGIINTSGGGASYFPGTVAGTTSQGGLYL